jgi:hypothetical protein
MRHEIEDILVDKQQAIANANDEIAQLKATIRALRDEMEHQKILCGEEIQELKRVAQDEQKQLQEVIQTLREQLERKNAF